MRLRNPHPSQIGNSLLYGADAAWDARCREAEAQENEARDDAPASEDKRMNQENRIKAIMESQAERDGLTVVCYLQDQRSPLLTDEAAAWRFAEYAATEAGDSTLRAVAHYWTVQHQHNAVLHGIGQRLRAQAARWLRFITREADNAR